MRKRFFFILSIVFSIAMMASPVSQQSALQEAMRFMKWQQAATSKPKMVKRGTSLNRSGADNASYYIFNAPGGEQGWAIVSGDDRTAPVLAYSPQGTIDPGRLSPAMQALLADYEHQLQALSMMDDATARRSMSAAARVPVATRHSIAPLIASKWDQATPYWNLCPQFMNSDGSGELAYTGCVATSIAQVMNYHKWPKTTTRVIPSYTFTYSNGGYDYGTATTEELPVASFDWNHMRNSYTGAEDEASIHAVAQLMQYAGYAVKMQYGRNSSGAYTDDIPVAFTRYFGYDSTSLHIAYRNDYSQTDWDNLIYGELESGRPVVYNGTAGSGGGHSFVCDGFEMGDFFHINWGWGGMGNGYFQLSVLNPNASGIGGAGVGEGYNMKQNAIVGIKPDLSQTGDTTVAPPDTTVVPQPRSLLSATGISINYNSTTATWERDSKSAGFSIYKSHYINVNFSDHQGSKKKFKEGLALYDMEGNMVELIMTTPVYGQVTSSALGDRVQFGRDLSASNSKKFGKGLVGDYRLVPVCQEQDSTQWLPMLESDRYYIEAKLTNYTATLTCHPVTNLEGKAVVVKGGEKVGLSARVDVTLANNSADRYYGNLYLWVDGEALDPTFTPYTSCITAEVPAGEQKTVSFNFTPTTAGTKSIVVTTDQDGMHAVTGATGSMTVEAKSEAAMNLEVAISALGAQQPAQAGEHGIVWDNQVTFKVTVTNKAAGDYNRYVLAPLFIVKTDSAGNTRGSMVTYEQTSLNLKPGESKDLQFTFDNLAYGSTYSLNVYARNDEPDDSEASHLTNLVKPGESKYYDLQRGLVTWTASGVRHSQQAAASITIPADAAAVSLEGLSFDNVTASANPNVVYLLGAADTVPAGLQGKNVVLGTVAPSLSLTAGHPFFTPVDFTAQQATFTRSLEPAGEHYNWSTMVLPFAPQRVLAQGNEINWRHAPAGRSQQVLVLELVEEDAASSELIFDYAAQMHSCRPYLVALARGVAPAQGMVTFEATQARVTAETKAITSGQSYLLRGTFNTASPAAPYVLRSDLCQFVPSPGVEVQPFEAWAQMLDGTTAATALNIVLPSDIVTGVTGVSVAAPKAGIVYDITGRVMQGSLQELPHGIYIVDGRKVVK